MKNIKHTIFFLLYLFQAVVSNLTYNETESEPEYLEKLYKAGRFKEFSQMLHINDVNLVKPSHDKKDPMYNKELEYGDILLAPFQRSSIGHSHDQLHFSTLKWEGYTVPYIIIQEGYSEDDITQILLSIYIWNQRVRNIKFRRRINEDDYVVIFNGNGCYANLGKISGRQSISLSSKRCMKRGTILHEMAHTVGLVHEHIRPDRDVYINILEGNIPEEWKSQYEKTDYSGYDVLGKYDYYSVMHYRLRAPVTRQPAFEVLQDGVDLSVIGQRDDLTELDVGKIRKLYN